MSKFRKKPVVIEAFFYDPKTSSTWPEWFMWLVDKDAIRAYSTHCEINTLEGTMRGEIGDAIIKGVKNEVYPCKPDIFVATYELVEDDITQKEESRETD